jgi:hypothetical protein
MNKPLKRSPGNRDGLRKHEPVASAQDMKPLGQDGLLWRPQMSLWLGWRGLPLQEKPSSAGKQLHEGVEPALRDSVECDGTGRADLV